MGGTGRLVVRDVIVGVGDPKGGRSRVRVEHREGLAHIRGQIALYDVLRLTAVLDEVRVASGFECHVVRDSEVVHTVDGHCPVVGVVHAVAPQVRLTDVPDHVEVERIPPNAPELAGVAELDILNAADERLVTPGMHHDVAPVLVQLREGCAPLHHDISREQAHVGA